MRSKNELEARVAELEDDAVKSRERIVELEAERDILKQKVDGYGKLLDQWPVSLSIVTNDRDRLKHRGRELEAERDRLAVEYADINESWKSDVDRLEAENARLRKALMKLRGAVDGLALDYPYLSECKTEAIEALTRTPEAKP